LILNFISAFPVTFPLGNAEINPHFIFEILAFFVGFRFYLYLRKGSSDSLNFEQRILIIIGAAAGALIFSRLIGNLENPTALFSGEYNFIQLYASKTIVGGLIGGLIGVETAKKFIGIKSSTGDLFTYPIILGMMIGRVGCFLSGVSEPTFGIESNLPWAMDLGDGLLRHPTSLYEILFLGLIWILLRWFSKKQPKNGDLFKGFMIFYLLFRFLIDFIKPTETLMLGLTAIQITCLLGLLYYGKSIYRIILLLISDKKHNFS